MPELPWKISKLTKAFPILLEMEEKKYKTNLVVVDESRHWEGMRTGRVLMKHECVSDQVQVNDRVIIRGSNGKTMDGYDKAIDEKFRFCRESDIEAVLPENLEVESSGSRR